MSAGARRLVLWRHGRTAWNADGRFQGQLDPPLDALGQRQARVAARVLARMGPVALLSSDLQRARDTAAVLGTLAGLPVRLDPGLREIHLGDWQGLSRAEARERYPDEYAEWQTGQDVRRGGGETYTEVGRRSATTLLAAVDELPPGSVLVAVAHGGTIRSAIGTLLGLDVLVWWRLAPLGNCRWSVMHENRRGWQLEEHNAGSPPADASGDDTR